MSDKREMGLGVTNVDRVEIYENETVRTNSSSIINATLLFSGVRRLLSTFRVKIFTWLRSSYYCSKGRRGMRTVK